MKSASITAIALALVGSAIAAPARQSSFQGLAIHSGSRIQFATVNANDGDFWLLEKTRTSCPSNVKCSNTTATIFTGGKDTLNLKVEVPGGQQVYVNDVGSLKFTQPHSAAIGEGSSQTGFAISKKGKFDYLTYKGNGFLACPTDANNYLIYVPGSSAVKGDSHCLGFDFLIGDDSAPAAWEYV
jgi:hypothetical protein